ncbi:MAG: DUF6173 family protein [Pelagimonas sp.]|jgi:hypothetical protein|nr:DUF6173 family protein [Pelagimonas sp.]
MNDEISTAAEAAEADALPRRRDVHTQEANTSADGPAALTKKPLKQKSPAEWAYERLILYIQKFEETLDNEHEVAMGMVGGDAGVLRIEGMGFFDPDIVTFYGSDPSGARTQLIQHVTQLNVMLRAMPKAVPQTEKPRRIGFRLAKELETDAA